MGSWGVKLNQNDFAEDIRAQYKNKLSEGISNEVATNELITDYGGILDDIDDGPNFWFILADQQWKLGRLLPIVKEQALLWIEKGGDLELWYAESQELGDARKKVLEDLKVQISSPQPEVKKISKKRHYICPWKIGDVFAYPLISNLAKENGLHGKFIIFQVAAKRKMKKNVDEYPVVRCWIAEELTFPPKTTCVKWSSIPRNDGNYNYGYFMIASSIRSVPKSIRFIGNFAEYIPVDDGGNIEEASDGVIWKCFEEKIVKDYLRDIE